MFLFFSTLLHHTLAFFKPPHRHQKNPARQNIEHDPHFLFHIYRHYGVEEYGHPGHDPKPNLFLLFGGKDHAIQRDAADKNAEENVIFIGEFQDSEEKRQRSYDPYHRIIHDNLQSSVVVLRYVEQVRIQTEVRKRLSTNTYG